MNSNLNDLKTAFEKDNNVTATYQEAIEFYAALDAQSDNLKVNEFGMTDSGFPLHEVIITNDGVLDPKNIRENGKAILFINNAIHPGEPCGVDASMMLARDLLVKSEMKGLLEKVSVVILPIYNISGTLNRGSFSRANQNGPKAYGFRGNIQNLDLNRDFVKGDTENSRSFNQLFSKWSPDILIDNHTSNGADYQYVMTLIATQKDKMEPALSMYLQENLLPDLNAKMKAGRYEMTPYVYARNTPDNGIAGFLDYPRYSSGYASLHNCISFMPETHMLKPFKDRVWSTYDFMVAMLEHIEKNASQLLLAREAAVKSTKTKPIFSLNWEMDREKVDTLLFKGYEAKYKPSAVSGKERLYYDRNAPYEKKIPFFNSYKPNLEINKPFAYIIPQAYKRIIDRMKNNNVEMYRLAKDEVREVEVYRIIDYTSTDKPYEGHYLHSNVRVEKSTESIQYYKGDYLIYTNQAMNKYIINTLEPQAPDSWFAWNFFDGILMQKEYFSSYVFEDLAADFLKSNPNVKQLLEAKKEEDAEFADNGYEQLKFIYERSPYFEPTYKRYPVGRMIED
ncbi:MAG: M14 family metallopeptidase [Bacteroidota bacterium]